MGIAGYYPLPRFQQIFFSYPALYVLGVSAGVLGANFSLVRFGVRPGYTPAQYAYGVFAAAPLVVLTRRRVPEQASTSSCP